MSMFENALSPARQKWLKAQRKERILIRCAKIGLLVAIMLIWELAARFGVIDPFITSCPSRFMKSIYRLTLQGELMEHILVTTGEAVAGFIFGTALGTLTAILLWYFDFARKVAEPYLVILNALPKIALGPIFIVWMIKEKDLGVFKRFVLPIASVICCGFMVFAAVYAHGISKYQAAKKLGEFSFPVLFYLIVFAVIMLAGMLLRHKKKK